MADHTITCNTASDYRQLSDYQAAIGLSLLTDSHQVQNYVSSYITFCTLY